MYSKTKWVLKSTSKCYQKKKKSVNLEIRNYSILAEFTFSLLWRSSNTVGVVCYGSYTQQIRWLPAASRKESIKTICRTRSMINLCPLGRERTHPFNVSKNNSIWNYMMIIHKIMCEIWIQVQNGRES